MSWICRAGAAISSTQGIERLAGTDGNRAVVACVDVTDIIANRLTSKKRAAIVLGLGGVVVVESLKLNMPRFLSLLKKQRKDDRMRVIIIHNHLFKNAGTTIDWALRKNFGKAFTDHRDDPAMRKGVSYLGSYLSGHKKIKALSTHHLTMPLPELPDTRLLQIMMFRHPIERVTSVYNFERKQAAGLTPGADHARKLSLRDYVLWRMTPESGPTIRNFHVRRTLPPRKARQERITKQEMQAAKDFVASLSMLGLVERFDESMALFEETLKPYFPDIDFSYVSQNIGQRVGESRQTRIERLQAEIGEDAFQLLLQKNREDLALYEWAEKEFAGRIAKVDRFQERLTGFQSRCNG